MDGELHIRNDGDKVQVLGESKWLYAEDPSTGHFMAICPPLNIFLEADTRDELFSLISESIDTLFKNLVKNNQLEEFLFESGWQKTGPGNNSIPLPEVNLKPVSLYDLQKAACG